MPWNLQNTYLLYAFNTYVEPKMVHSGIPGLDEILGGELSRKSCVLLHGGPGSGKTTLAIQFLYNGVVENNEPGIFISLCENPDEIRRNMLAFGWDLAKLERQRKLAIIDARPVTYTEEGYIIPDENLFKGETVPFSHISRKVMDAVKEIGAKRLVIDSVTVLTSQYDNPAYVRQGLLGLIQVLCSLDCVSMLLSENIGKEYDEPSLEWIVVPGLIVLYYARKGSSMVRAIQVRKVRGLKHSSDIYHMEIGNQGIVIHPEERAEF